jgi:hypothetical protein
MNLFNRNTREIGYFYTFRPPGRAEPATLSPLVRLGLAASGLAAVKKNRFKEKCMMLLKPRLHGWMIAPLLGMLMHAGACSAQTTGSSGDAGHTGQAGHGQHGGAHRARSAELGVSAVADKLGRLWLAAKESTDGQSFVVVQQSSDLGKTWSAPVRVQREPEPVAAGGESRPHIALGPNEEIYVVYTRPIARPHIGEIRFSRSLDGGKSFSAPMTVHANREVVTHSFESMIVDREGRIYVAWIDGRDQAAAKAKGQKYAGSALYYAVSTDGGASFRGDYRVADHTCECCRIGLALNAQGRPVAMWRHVFEPNIRDHAVAELSPDGRSIRMTRASFDDWRIDACPHHGPSLAYADDGVRHQVWFNGKESDASGALYARTLPEKAAGRPETGLTAPNVLGNGQGSHADVAAQGKRVAVAWKQFDGDKSAVLARVSDDNGQTWKEQVLATTAGDSDKPYLVTMPKGFVTLWRTRNEGIRILEIQGETPPGPERPEGPEDPATRPQ